MATGVVQLDCSLAASTLLLNAEKWIKSDVKYMAELPDNTSAYVLINRHYQTFIVHILISLCLLGLSV
jgi:hypothetical protein